MVREIDRTFEKDVKKRLIDLDWTIERLADEVSKKTGMFCDTSYIFKIWRGERNAPKIVSAVKEILGLGEF